MLKPPCFYIVSYIMGLDPKIWLPHFQFVMLTMALSYPKRPNDVSNKKYYDFIQNLPVFLPDNPMGDHFIRLLDDFPVTPYLTSQMSFMKWVHFINNKLNLAMNEPEIDFYESLEKYYEEYKPIELKEQETYKGRKKYIQFAVVFAIGALIIYSYGK